MSALIVTMDTGEKLTVETRNPDRIAWDRTSRKHKWGPFSESPFIGMTFLAWAGLTRTKQVDCTWEEFSETRCVDIESDDEDDAADPI
ncbi:hypothetical protein [Tomitella biformata]|uniref:hypothetical protein n=1 Tax=Tomitella biformata TaxID=630403 RepID=UPI000467849F|nr:hypothetical protein [Tomitella biformata]